MTMTLHYLLTLPTVRASCENVLVNNEKSGNDDTGTTQIKTKGV